MIRVLIAEDIPSSNKGEATLMLGIYKTVKEACGGHVQFALCSSNWENDHRAYGEILTVLKQPGFIHKVYGISKLKKILIRTYSIARHFIVGLCMLLLGKSVLKIFREELWEAYINSDVFLIGHDNSFSKYHLPLILFAKLLNKPIVVYGATIQPNVLNSSFFRAFGSYCLNKVDLITTREPLSLKYLKQIGVNKPPMFSTADKAFLLDPIPGKEVDKLMERTGVACAKRPLIGVMLVRGSNVFKAAFSYKPMTVEEKYSRHISELAKAMDRLYDALGGSIIFVPHSIGPHAEVDDRIVHRDVVEHMKNSIATIVLEDDLEPAELKGLMGRFDMTISERTHGGIASATMMVPTLWISHPGDIRTYGIVGKTIDMPDCLYDISYLESETLFEKMIWLWTNREEIKGRLRSGISIAKNLSMQNGQYFRRYIVESLNLGSDRR